jgi:hypothetical protein
MSFIRIILLLQNLFLLNQQFKIKQITKTKKQLMYTANNHYDYRFLV